MLVQAKILNMDDTVVVKIEVVDDKDEMSM